MIIEEAIEILKTHNEWRRGAEIEQLDHNLIGQAIDRIITYAKFRLEEDKEVKEKLKKFLTEK